MSDNLIKVTLRAPDKAVTPARASHMAWLATTLLEGTGALPLCRIVSAEPVDQRKPPPQGIHVVSQVFSDAQVWVVSFEPATTEENERWLALDGNKHLDDAPFMPSLIHFL